jgi:hypothetical protein
LPRAFDFEHIDALNKPFTIPSEGEAKAAREKLDREHVTLKAIPLTTGRQLARLAEACSMDMSEPAFELSREAEETFAALVDYFGEYRDCADAYSHTQKLDVHDEMQSYINTLKTLGVLPVLRRAHDEDETGHGCRQHILAGQRGVYLGLPDGRAEFPGSEGVPRCASRHRVENGLWLQVKAKRT